MSRPRAVILAHADWLTRDHMITLLDADWLTAGIVDISMLIGPLDDHVTAGRANQNALR